MIGRSPSAPGCVVAGVGRDSPLLERVELGGCHGWPTRYSGFKVLTLFEDPLSDQVPSERAHAIWNKVGGRYPWSQQTADLLRTVKVRLDALEAVTRKLQADLKGTLIRQAPRVTAIQPPPLLNCVAADGQLW